MTRTLLHLAHGAFRLVVWALLFKLTTQNFGVHPNDGEDACSKQAYRGRLRRVYCGYCDGGDFCVRIARSVALLNYKLG
jgi:hypothetical protein